MVVYIYEGPVVYFGKVIDSKWRAETQANTITRAITNLKYRAKTEHGLIATTAIKLPGKFTVTGKERKDGRIPE